MLILSFKTQGHSMIYKPKQFGDSMYPKTIWGNI